MCKQVNKQNELAATARHHDVNTLRMRACRLGGVHVQTPDVTPRHSDTTTNTTAAPSAVPVVVGQQAGEALHVGRAGGDHPAQPLPRLKCHSVYVPAGRVKTRTAAPPHGGEVTQVKPTLF